MRVLVLGAGATGGYFGARLIESGHDVVFLVRPARAEQLRRDGLRIHSANGDYAAPVATLTAVGSSPAFDIVLLSCKAYDLDSAIAAVAPAIGPSTRVLPLLNGLRHFELLDLAFGTQRVWGGLCHISVSSDDDGAIRHYGQLDRLTFGARVPDDRLSELAPPLLASRADVRRTDDIVGAMWEKFAFLAALAGMTCLMRASVGEIVAAPDGAWLLERCYGECAEIAGNAGYAIAPTARADALRILTAERSPLKASMLRDLERGGRNECEHILGDLLKRATELGVDTPLLTAACAHVRLAQPALRAITA